MDKFEIFKEILIKEAESNHYGTYITIGQLREILYRVDRIAENPIKITQERSIVPLGEAGKNKL